MDLAVKLLCGVVLVGAVSGCTTTQGSSQLQARVTQLERTVSKQEQVIDELRMRNNMGSGRAARSSAISSSSSIDDSSAGGGLVRVPVDPRDVQAALQKAGYYSGNIDGKIGGQTIEAIKKFQSDNNLKVDGIVGANTWARMQSVAAASGSSSAAE